MASSHGILLKLACLVVICIAGAPPKAKAKVTCGQVVNNLTPCIFYVTNGGTVPADCCNGIKSLNNMAQNTADRQAVCKCIKDAVSGFSYNADNVALAAGLPSKCGLNLPYKISPSTDCQSVK